METRLPQAGAFDALIRAIYPHEENRSQSETADKHSLLVDSSAQPGNRLPEMENKWQFVQYRESQNLLVLGHPNGVRLTYDLFAPPMREVLRLMNEVHNARDFEINALQLEIERLRATVEVLKSGENKVG